MKVFAAGLRLVAVFEAAKGAVVLGAGCGLAALLHRDAERYAAEIVERLHLNPAKKYPRIFIDAASSASDAQLIGLAGFALLYASLRFVEAYGLWNERRWAEWVAAVSGGVYVPFEVYELSHGVSALKLAALLVNTAIVGYMLYALASRRRS